MSRFRFENVTLVEAVEFLSWRHANNMYQDELFKDTIICQRVVTLAQESAAGNPQWRDSRSTVK